MWAITRIVACVLSLLHTSNSQPTRAIEFQKLGVADGYDYYNEVVHMVNGDWPPPCNKNPSFTKQRRCVSGPLAPFNEDLTMVFRGPMELNFIASYVPVNSLRWKRSSFWNQTYSENIGWFSNSGGNGVGGSTWDTCHGNSQAYASSDGSSSTPLPVQFKGFLRDGIIANALSDEPCDVKSCGFTRGPSRRGFHGKQDGRQFLIARFRAPVSENLRSMRGVNDDLPAFWLLNARIVRTAQFGANCWSGSSGHNCGEIDIAEAIPGQPKDRMYATVYSLTGAVGSPHWFVRPYESFLTVGVLFEYRNGTKRGGSATIFELPDFDPRSKSLSSSYIRTAAGKWKAAVAQLP